MTSCARAKTTKLRSIPVRLLFNEPELNFRADYTLFDRQNGRPGVSATVRPASVSVRKAFNRCPARRPMPAPWPRAMPASPTDE